ncbi:MAG TPA: NAD-dependent epimerase/dehydratase family protein [Devosia sp.]|nr:NAD-dependent epimerase/dehydratase family protein [Devosia sp.]
MSDAYNSFYRDKVVLVTGGGGAIGANLVTALAQLEAKTVIILDDMSASYDWLLPRFKNVLFVKGDVANEIDLKRVFNEGPDIVFHLAAFFANQNSIDYPERDLNTNGLGTLRLLQYAKLANVSKFIFASSGCSIYGSAAPLPLTEDFMSMHLTTPYQITKMLGELYCNFFLNQYKLPVVKARFFNSYGPGEVPGQYRNVIPNFIYWALQGEPLPITGTGEATRDFTYVGDLVAGLLAIGVSEEVIGGEFNLASAREIRIGDLASMINEITGNKAGIKTVPVRVWDTKKRLLASIDRANSAFGYKPAMRFEDGLDITVNWFRQNWDDIRKSASFPPGMASAVRGR